MSGETRVKVESRGGVAIVTLTMPVDQDTATDLKQAVEKKLEEGLTRFAFDFSQVRLIPSPVVAMVLEMTEKVVDDRHGKVIVCGLSELNQRVFEMVGVFLYAESCPTLKEAEVKALL